MTLKTGSIPMFAASLALFGCQQESPNPAGNAETATDREYALEVQKLKAGPAESFQAGLASLDSKFGFPAAPTGTEAPAREAPALEKTARQYVFSAEGDCMELPKYIIKVAPGDRVKFMAGSLIASHVGTSDPVAMLIRLKNPEFVSGGILPNTGTTGYDILAWNDDEAVGSLSAVIDYTVKANQGGYYMAIAYPYDNSSSKRFVSISMDITRANCPTCNERVLVPLRVFGGLVYPIKGGDDFLATQVTGVGDPRIYVNMNTLGSGVTNGNSTSATLNARAYPYPVTATQGQYAGNTVIIDNDAVGTHLFRHWQFKP
jgi:hypothetical protein